MISHVISPVELTSASDAVFLSSASSLPACFSVINRHQAIYDG